MQVAQFSMPFSVKRHETRHIRVTPSYANKPVAILKRHNSTKTPRPAAVSVLYQTCHFSRPIVNEYSFEGC